MTGIRRRSAEPHALANSANSDNKCPIGTSLDSRGLLMLISKANAAILLCALAVPASISASPVRALSCDDSSTQSELNECAGGSLEAAQNELDARVATIVERLAPNSEAQTLFRAAQARWTEFRDSECAFAASGVSGGSIYPLIYGECLAHLTQSRHGALAPYLECEEGDISCPVPPS